MSNDELDEAASRVLDSLEAVPAGALRIAGQALELGGGPLAGLGFVFDLLADATGPDGHGSLSWPRLQLRHELRQLAADPGELLERLAGVEQAPWAAVRDALEELAAAS